MCVFFPFIGDRKKQSNCPEEQRLLYIYIAIYIYFAVTFGKEIRAGIRIFKVHA